MRILCNEENLGYPYRITTSQMTNKSTAVGEKGHMQTVG